MPLFSDTDFLLRLLNTPSPTGYTERATALIAAEVETLGLTVNRSRKGTLSWTLPNKVTGQATDGADGKRHIGLSAHTDTLGAMVKEILPHGRLGLSQLGGYDWATIEGEYVTVHTQTSERAGEPALTGTVVNNRQSTHVWGQALRDLKRSGDNLEVRLDVDTRSAAHTRSLGVSVGDFVSFDPRAVLTPAGYIKSRHLDNKAGVAALLSLTRLLLASPVAATVSCFVTTYEEVGHGAAPGFAVAGLGEVTELVAVDMAAVGGAQTSHEHGVTLCVKDSTGPYDFALSNQLRAAARRAGLDLMVDIYPYYGSDASAAMAAGHDLPAALIGPGVDASHAYERTHLDALEATVALLLAHVKGDED